MHPSATGYVACKASRLQTTMSAWVGRNKGSIMARGVRKSITIPGLLATTVKLRCAEFRQTIFTPYAVELVCYDLRSDANHTTTLALPRDKQAPQHAAAGDPVAHQQ